MEEGGSPWENRMPENTAGNRVDPGKTEVGSYFIANYPPFYFWTEDHLPAVEEVLERTSSSGGQPRRLGR